MSKAQISAVSVARFQRGFLYGSILAFPQHRATCPMGRKRKRAAIYARVSTTNGQTPENQLIQLRRVAKKAGWNVVEEYVDHGISGAKGRDQRPAYDRLCKTATQREFDVVMAWSVDRLGRSLQLRPHGHAQFTYTVNYRYSYSIVICVERIPKLWEPFHGGEAEARRDLRTGVDHQRPDA